MKSILIKMLSILVASATGFSVTPARASMSHTTLTDYVSSIDCDDPRYVKPSRAERLAVKNTETVGYSCIMGDINFESVASTITEYLNDLDIAPPPKKSCASLACYIESLEEADECALL